MSAPQRPAARRISVKHISPFSKAELYYDDQSSVARHDPRQRTFSAVYDGTSDHPGEQFRHRRGSLDAVGTQPRSFLIPVESTLKKLLAAEDTDGNTQITIDDDGPKVISIGTARSGGFRRTDVRGTYVLSNLLQELTLAQDFGRKMIELDEARLNENPVDRLARMISDFFWKNLTRVIDGQNIATVAKDPKDWTSDPRPRVYVPPGAPEQYRYYTKIAREHPNIRLDVQWLPPSHEITPEYIRDLNDAPGLLAIAMDEFINKKGEKELRGKPFVVPGGRFNELYGWDSYMISLGLLLNDKVNLAKSMVENFCFCIEHYGKILNANRSYYLGRSQPPFMTDMTLRVYNKIQHEEGATEFLRNGILAAIKEYYTVWMSAPRYDKHTGLSRYRPAGVGVPPETEATHFVHILQPYADKHEVSFEEFVRKYNFGEIQEPQLDDYFLHDRAIRESGHDTSYRLERIAADLATVDLNSCLYKIETDIARTIRRCFGDRLEIPKEFQVSGMNAERVEMSATWDRRAKIRRLQMDKYMWNEDAGMYFDYNTKKRERTGYESATTFWAMWAGVATPRQAGAMVVKALPLFEELGGLASGTERSRGKVGLDRPNRQWDYPFGWAPQQILAWIGMQRYGFEEEATRLAYKWLFMVTKAFVDFNGVVVEKYDVTQPNHPHRVAAEYGNQGADFKGVPREGFGWVNASYTYGLSILDMHAKRALGTLTSWETYYNATQDLDVHSAMLSDEFPESEHLSRSHTGLFHEMTSSWHNLQVQSPSGLGHLRQSQTGHAVHEAHMQHPKTQLAHAAAIETSKDKQRREHEDFERTKAALASEAMMHMGKPHLTQEHAIEEP